MKVNSETFGTEEAAASAKKSFYLFPHFQASPKTVEQTTSIYGISNNSAIKICDN